MSIFQASLAEGVQTFQSLSQLQEPLQRAARIVEKSLLAGGKLLVCGNGGSAADGADFSTEYTCRFVGDRLPYPAINLADAASLVTAIGNDYGYEEVFARQVRAYAKPGDVLVAISTSGNSRNILKALEQANGSGIKSIALLGKGGGKCAELATVDLIVPTTQTTARIQEAHKFLLHMICELVEGSLAKA